MVINDYECRNCGDEREYSHTMAKRPTSCDNCGEEGTLRIKFHKAPGINTGKTREKYLGIGNAAIEGEKGCYKVGITKKISREIEGGLSQQVMEGVEIKTGKKVIGKRTVPTILADFD